MIDEQGRRAPQRQSALYRLRHLFEFLYSLFTLSSAAIALVVLIVAFVFWRYRKLD